MQARDEFAESASQRPPLQPDRAVIRAHLERMFAWCRKDYMAGLVEIAWTNPDKVTGGVKLNSARLLNISPEGLDEAADLAVEKSAQGRNVYLGVNPRKPDTAPFGRASAEDVEVSKFQFIDCDTAEATGFLAAAPLRYTFAVTTGRVPTVRPHAYWELDAPTRDMLGWERRQRALKDFFHSDAVTDPPRVMRLAGTVNWPPPHKVERGYQPELATLRVLYDGREREPVTCEALQQTYAYKANGNTPPPGDEPRTDDTASSFGDTGINVEKLIAAIRAGKEWHNNVLALVAHLVNTGTADAVILALAEAITFTGYTVDATRKDLEVMIRGARAKWNIPNEDAPIPETNGLCLLVAEWLARDIPAPDFLLGEWLHTTTRAMLVAPTGLGKTNFSFAAAFAMALGVNFLHWRVPRSARVLLIDGEMSRRLFKKRLADATRRAGQAPATLFALCKDDVQGMPPLNTPQGQAFLDRIVSDLGGVDFIIFDSVMALLIGDMKDEEPWQLVLPYSRDLTRRSIGQLWIHHTGHDETHSYGTKTREWQLDTVTLLESIERPGTDIAFTLKFTKSRERSPDNRADFEPVAIVLADDQWRVEELAPTASAKRPSPKACSFHGALLDALVVVGKPRPESANRASCTTDEWKAEACRLGLVEQPPPGSKLAKRDASLFNKYRLELIAARWVGCNGDYAWNIAGKMS